MRPEAGCLIVLIELSIPLDSPFACRLSSSMLAFRSLSLQSAVDNGRNPRTVFPTIRVERRVQKVPPLMWWTAGFRQRQYRYAS
jgi:hypothetical protein